VGISRLAFGILATAVAFGLSPSPSHAGTFSISPLRVEFSASVKVGALTIRNQEDSPVVVQAQAMLWEQGDGQDRLTPTRDVLVSPAVFTVPGNGSQLVRLALRVPADARRELSYRVILTEVPQQPKPGYTGLNVALRLSLPVFVAPAEAATPQLEWSASRDADGAISITARNTGDAHDRVLSFQAASSTGTPVASEEVAAYLLPGQSRTWRLDNQKNTTISGAGWNRFRVKGTTEAGDFEVETLLKEH